MHTGTGHLYIFIIVGMAVFCVLTLIVVLKCYKRTGPGRAMIVSGFPPGPGGRNRVVIDGGTLVWPFIQQVTYISLAVESLEVSVTDAYTKDDLPTSVTAVAQFKVQAHPDGIVKYAERFLENQSEKKQAVARIVKTQLLAKFRTESLPDIFADRGLITSKVIDEAADELADLGLDMVSLDLTDISDESGSLGG